VTTMIFLFASYLIGLFIFVWEMKTEHSDWQLFPIGLLALVWPYLTVRRCFVFWRTYQSTR
jgi:hypothetical protein